VLRARFRGTPEHVIRYFFFVAEELRVIMARLGFRTIDEMVGRADCVVPREDVLQAKPRMLDFSRVLLPPKAGAGPLHCVTRAEQAEHRDEPIDELLLEEARLTIKYGEPSSVKTAITNADRAFGARVAGELARKWGERGLPDGTLTIEVTGTAGQSFGAFATKGMLVVLTGDANDYVGKGLSGGVLAIHPHARAHYRADHNVIVGNTVLYGATSGKAYFAGRAGERFAVRNSGAVAVVEGVGDHGCEYMTGGVVVVLGATGRNFGAGMSGGLAFVLDEDGAFSRRVNGAMVDLEPMDDDDAAAVRALVEDHVAHTRSQKGTEVLAGWSSLAARFVKVVPREYQKLAERRKLDGTSAALPRRGQHQGTV
jgi:glutamate synthase (NADPH/NADH) large chain